MKVKCHVGRAAWNFLTAWASIFLLGGYLSAADLPEDPFLVKPYVQLGDAPSLSPREYHASLNHFTLVEIAGRKLTLRQISLDGAELDRLTIMK